MHVVVRLRSLEVDIVRRDRHCLTRSISAARIAHASALSRLVAVLAGVDRRTVKVE
jgi:hypothetical protein